MSEERSADYEIRNLERRAADLQKAGRLTEVRDALEDVDAALSQLPADLAAARTRGYVFKSYLEEQIEAMRSQWNATRDNVRREIDRRERNLASELGRVEPAVRRLQPYRGRSLSSAQSAIDRVKGDLSSVERQVEAAAAAVTGMFDTVQSGVREVKGQIDECVEMLDWMDKASFGFQPGETGVSAVEAKWLQDGRKEGPKGILFLTDRRILFEQREKVAKKKVLFITTASEEVQELLWEAPLGALSDAAASEKRQALVLKKERLTLKFRPPATVREVLLEIGGDSDAWRALVNRVVSGDIDQERVQGSQETRARETQAPVPSKCPNCGAALDTTVIKGMTAIKCGYCGTSIPL